MIAEILPECYDVEGRKVFRPDSRRHSGFKPTFPIGRFLSQPLRHWCADLAEIRKFLAGCNYVSDQEQFGERDYWQPPEEFEKTKKGDCEDFALWAWRQLLHLSYDVRFVVGFSGRYGAGHAWLTFQRDGKVYLFEPLAARIGLTLPQLSVIRYDPKFSISWDGRNVSYFEHKPRKFLASLPQILSLVMEWLAFWLVFWPKIAFGLSRKFVRKAPGSLPKPPPPR